MWIQSSVMRSLSLALLLLLASAYGGFSETYYSISESELIELETILTQQETTIERQRQTLNELLMRIDNQHETLTTLSQTIERQATSIDALGTSFSEYETAARWATIRAGGIGALVGGLTVALIFATFR